MQKSFNTQMSMRADNQRLESRIVRYGDLIPCTTAFIDARTPGSDAKENFTIIGPGVAENPDQHVHITEPHGFNIGGARQPPGCLNSQHFHETAEVFFVHSGRWAFRTGEHADEGEVVMEPGDTISIPVHVFRGFENVGAEPGFLYAVLGGDDPGRVVWAPDVLENARGHGLVLLESGRLIDTLSRHSVPKDDPVVQPETRAALERIVRQIDTTTLGTVVVRGGFRLGTVPGAPAGVVEQTVLGEANLSEPAPASPLAWSHGFVCRRVRLAPDSRTPALRRQDAEVIFVHAGGLELEVEGEHAHLAPGDTVTIPVGAVRRMSSRTGADLFVTRAGNAPQPAELLDEATS